MRKLALILGVPFIFALTAAVEASVQTEPLGPPTLGSPLNSPLDREIDPAEDICLELVPGSARLGCRT